MTKDANTVKPPSGLSKRSRELWAATISEYDLEPHHRALFEEALRALDRADQARAVLDAEGLTITSATTGATKQHPVAAVERDQRIAFARLMRQLDLEGEVGPAPARPRPPGRHHDAET